MEHNGEGNGRLCFCFFVFLSPECHSDSNGFHPACADSLCPYCLETVIVKLLNRWILTNMSMSQEYNPAAASHVLYNGALKIVQRTEMTINKYINEETLECCICAKTKCCRYFSA